MNSITNIYCDESCHLLNDGNNCMVLGSLIIPYNKVVAVSDMIKGIKSKYGMNVHNELKWVKVSSNKLELYLEVIRLFLDDNDLKFRCVVVPDKSVLNHQAYNRTHDWFYYVMYYYGLKFVLKKGSKYNIYFDYKDVHQNGELRKLKTILQKELHFLPEDLKLQPVLSFESQIMQVCDLLTGAVSYYNRGLSSSSAKSSIVRLLEDAIHQKLDTTSLIRDEKFNVFVWKPNSGWGSNA